MPNTSVARRARVMVAMVFVGGLGACHGASNPTGGMCYVAADLPLGPTALTQISDVRLINAGGALTMVGVEGATVRWGRVTDVGVVGPEAALTLPSNLTLGPWFALTSKTTAADQLVVIYGVPKNGNAGQLELRVVTQTQGADAAPSRSLVDLPANVDASIVRVAVGTSSTGLHAAYALGYQGQNGAPIAVTLLGADATATGNFTLDGDDAPTGWNCLSFGQGRAALAVSAFAPGNLMGHTDWRIIEVGDGAAISEHLRVDLSVDQPGCPAFSVTPRGYAMAWQTADGTFAIDYDINKSSVQQVFVAGAVRFGGPTKQPPLGAVIATSTDPAVYQFGIVFADPGAPQLWTYDVFGNIKGDPLLFASAGAVGPVSATPGVGTVTATYLDARATAATDAAPVLDGDGGAPEGGVRHLVRVQCAAH